MGYFSKEVYQRKEDYAYRISTAGLDKIVYSILTENKTEQNAKIIKEQIDSKTYSDEMWNLYMELMPITNLSQSKAENYF